MINFLSNSKTARTVTNVANLDENSADSSIVWNTEKVNKLLEDHENGIIDIKTLKHSPFKDNDPSWKKTNIVWQYSPEEYEELEKCKADVVYFAEKYCEIMTEDGVKTVNLFDYQKEIVNHFKDDRMSILMASRQVGKCFLHNSYICIKLKTNQLSSKFLNFSKNSILNTNGEISTSASEVFYFIRYETYGKLKLVDKIKRKLYQILNSIQLNEN